ncbi:heavy metal translocating P-type ATPase [Candidatus Bipolaricaulota bacterium]|nr:heavy metal translocating P-type ATPase [Candidatus Bipolaricaulota bacterium]
MERKKNDNEIQLRIEGMTCAGCSQSVENALARVPGVKEAAVNLMTERVTIKYADSVSSATLVAAVSNAGYKATLLVPSPERRVRLEIEGMTCASCSRAVENALARLPEVRDVVVNLTTEEATVVLAAELPVATLKQAVEKAGFQVGAVRSSAARIAREDPAERDRKKLAEARRRMVLAWVFVVPTMGWMVMKMVLGVAWPSPLLFNLGMLILAAPAVFIAGRQTLYSGVKAAVHRAPTMDTLIGLGAAAAYLTGFIVVSAELGFGPRLLNFSGVAAMIIAFHLTGRYIEAIAKGRASQAIKRLLSLGAKTARVLRDGAEVEVPIDEVVAGDLMLVRPGEKVPTDGMIEKGSSHIDESIVTGESMPIRRTAGDQVIGATVNNEGLLHVRATGVGEETFLAQVIRMVEEAQGSKVPIQEFADRVTAVFVPIVLGIALLTAIAWLVFPTEFVRITQAASGFLPWVDPTLSPLSLALFAAIAVLVIACPCALGLATPTALMVGSGVGAQNGILIRSGEAIQTMKGVTTIVFDKTGTITEGRPGVTDLITTDDGAEEELLRLAASVEVGSEHPIGRAIVREAEARGLDLQPVGEFAAVPGKGVRGLISGEEVLIGTTAFLAEEGLSVDEIEDELVRIEVESKSVIVVGVVGRGLRGTIAVADRVKPDAAGAIAALIKLGLTPMILTGDNETTARAIARSVGIDQVVARLLPGEKVATIERLQASGEIVAMVGDGINDAPALKAANVGVAIGTGTDVAIEAADITLIAGDLTAVTKAVRLSRGLFQTIRQNLFWAFFYNTISIPIAMLGLLHPLIGMAAMAVSSINVVANANRLRRIDLSM